MRGANTYTGGTTISAGTLRGNTTSLRGSITNNAALVFDQTVNGAFEGQILGTGSLLKTSGGTLTLNGPGLSYSGDTNVREGAILHSSGSNTQSAQLRVGDLGGLNGAYTLTGTAVLSTPTIVVGVAGTGVFNQSGGSASAGTQLTLGDDAGSNGTFNLSAGSLTARQVHVGIEGLGVFHQTGGTMVVDGDSSGGQLILGSESGASGMFNLSGGTLLVSDSVFVGSSGAAAALNVSGSGSLTVENTLVVHDDLTSRINLSGGTINAKALNLKGVPANLNWTAGTLNIASNVTWDSAAAISSTSAAFGAALVVGASQTLKVTGNETLGGSGPFSLTLNDGGTHQVTGTMTVAANGTLTQNAGSTIAVSALVLGGGTINGTLQNQSTFVYQSGSFNGRLLNQGVVSFGQNLTLADGVRNEATLAIGLNQTLNADGAGLDNQSNVNLNSGTLGGAGPLVNHSLLLGDGTIAGSGGFTNVGSVYVVGGTLAISNSGINSSSGQIGVSLGQQLHLFGSSLVSTGMIELEGGVVSGTAMLNNSTGIVNGFGTISSPLTNSGALVIEGGILAVSNAFANSGEVVLAGGLATLSGSGAMNNTGIVRGEGAIAKVVNNHAGGEIRAENGKRIRFQGAAGPNSGTIQLQGGTAEFAAALTNAAGGQIQGRGTLATGGAGLTNNGQIAISSGITDIRGDVHNATGVATRGITISGNADVTFWDDVSSTANSLFRVSSGSSVTVFGNYSGAGISGNGNDIQLEGDVNPGFGPAAVEFGGNMHFSPSTRLNIEIGGTTAGVEYDQVRVSEQLTLHGTLVVSRINGFSPQVGDSFTILDWGTRVGTFADVRLPALAGSLGWSTSELYNTGTLTVVAVQRPGDYNDDGTVDAADYVVWRKFNMTSTALPNDPYGGTIGADQYNTWRSNFGRRSPGSSSAGASHFQLAVPEPSTFVLLVAAILGFVSHFHRRAVP
jgi:autotransporter-associated beta strand protein